MAQWVKRSVFSFLNINLFHVDLVNKSMKPPPSDWLCNFMFNMIDQLISFIIIIIILFILSHFFSIVVCSLW